ncbi:cytochrome P450 [Streptomyces sp. NPDC018045]|uniref:cytochrome P450 n=1 Tax=Streptomyces sp. NPDC018045 TaxID=3365037 RepID=UPI0037B3193A
MTRLDHDTVRTVGDLPVAERRDDAWRTLLAQEEPVRMADGLAVTGLAAVKAVLREPNRFSAKKAFDTVETGYPLIPLAFDPPEQTRYRRILQPFFSPRRIRPLEETLRARAVALVEAVKARGACDFVADVAVPFPAQALLTLLGLPLEDHVRFTEWKNAAIELTADASGELPLTDEERTARIGRTMAMGGYLAELIHTRRAHPGDDILSELLAIDGADRLSDDEALGLCLMFVMAGLETVTDALSLGMERLATHPERRRELADDLSLVPAAVEELLRLDPPAPFLPRVTTEDVEIAGCPVPAGTWVNVHLSTANRDEAGCPHAETIDFHRPDNAHTSFGLGAHRCLGAHLARLEMQLLLEEWHRRIPEYTITEGTPHRARLIRANIGMESLRLTLGGA